MYKIILAFRFLLKRRISYLALAAIGLCVFIVVIVMTVMTGLVEDFKDKNHNYVGDCVVGTESLVGFAYYEQFMRQLESQDYTEAVCPVINSYVLVSASGMQQSYGLELIGVEPASFAAVSGFGGMLHYHRDDAGSAFCPVYEPNLPGFVIGIDKWLERDTGGGYVHRQRPNRTALDVTSFPLTAKGALARAGTDMVRTKTFYFSDTAHSGIARVDDSVIYLDFKWAQQLCGMAGAVPRASAVYIKFRPGVKLSEGCRRTGELWKRFTAENGGEQYSELFDTVTVQSWKQNRRQFVAAMEQQQLLLMIMFFLAGVTTVFIVFVVFYMIVSHKSKDIGILKSIGSSDGDIMKLFGYFGCFLGLGGFIMGSFSGWLFLVYINRIEGWLFERFGFQLWDRTIYAIGRIPNSVSWRILLAVLLSAVAVSVVGAFIPVCRAVRCEPAEVLQVNQL